MSSVSKSDDWLCCKNRMAILSLKIDTCNSSCLNVEMYVLLLIVNDLIC